MGRHIIKTMARLRLISIGTASALIIGALAVFSITSANTETTKTSNTIAKPAIRGIILPHHLLVGKYMDDFYKLTAENRKDISRIILLSPNHFLYGFHYIQSTDQDFSGKDLPELDKKFIKNLSENTPLRIEPQYFEKEHGIMAQLPFIKKYFPKAKVVPIILKNNIPQTRLDPLIKEILKSDLSDTLIIASIDFTHYEPESVALKNDNLIISWLTKWSEKEQKETFKIIKTLAKSDTAVTRSAVSMDSPESFYITTRLMEELKAKNAAVWKRTSSASLLNNKNPLQNTSHLFIYFE